MIIVWKISSLSYSELERRNLIFILLWSSEWGFWWSHRLKRVLVELAFCVFTQVENKAAVRMKTASFGQRVCQYVRKHELFAQILTLGYATAEIMKSNGNIGCLLCWLWCFCGRVNEQAVQADCNNNIQVRARLRVFASGRFYQHSNTSSAINYPAIVWPLATTGSINYWNLQAALSSSSDKTSGGDE